MSVQDPNKIVVLIVEDSPVTARLISHILRSDPQIEVCGIASDGAEAIQLLEHMKPDVMTVDINMPGMNGFELTRRIMENEPRPIVIVSAFWSPEEVAMTFRALEAGAVAIVAKPHGPGQANHEEEARKLVQTVKSMSQLKLVRRWSAERLHRSRAGETPPVTAQQRPAKALAPVRLVAIGASTGGPVVLQTILSGLPRDFRASVVIVQHIAPGFIPALAEWLTRVTGFSTRVARHGDVLLNSVAYLAPDGFHMCIEKGWRIVLSTEPPDMGLRPSVSRLFASVAQSHGFAAAGVLLTGMGCDGAEGLLSMRQCGAVTIAQDQETSVVFGMPGQAVRMGAATHVLRPEQIAELLTSLAEQ